VPETLRAAGVDIRVHDELFPQGTQDVDWLNEAGANGWIVITGKRLVGTGTTLPVFNYLNPISDEKKEGCLEGPPSRSTLPWTIFAWLANRSSRSRLQA